MRTARRFLLSVSVQNDVLVESGAVEMSGVPRLSQLRGRCSSHYVVGRRWGGVRTSIPAAYVHRYSLTDGARRVVSPMSQVKGIKRLRSITSILASASSVRRVDRVDQRDIPHELEAEPLFTEAAIERQFDRAAWLRDGYVVLDGIMTERARHDWAAALHRVLAANDEFIMSDWDLVDLHGC